MLVQTLRQLPLFANFTDELLQCLVVQGKEVRLYAGDVLFREGEPAEGVYVLLEGELEITKQVCLLAGNGTGKPSTWLVCQRNLGPDKFNQSDIGTGDTGSHLLHFETYLFQEALNT